MITCCYGDTICPEILSNTTIFTSSSPFKVTNEDQSVQPHQAESSNVNRKRTNLFDSSADCQPAHTDKLLENEEDLSMFESKLSNQEFRKKITLELKRYAKDSLPSTVRAVMRFLFKDKLLNIFSYKGQKGKKVFYTLTICSVIFDSIKLMKKFNKFDTIEVETPLRIFISGAKFRDVPKTKIIQAVDA
ncbi:hypothetical protein ACI65C_013573 [Semiaphis heraclei]